MMKILLISNNQNVSKALQSLLSNSDITLAIFDKEQPLDFFDFQAAFIVEPYILKEEYLSIFSIWKRYLASKAQQTKLLILGFKRVDHPNYINLLDISASFDWKLKINQSFWSTEDWPGQSSLRNAPDILDKLSLFFTGHNHESIIDCIAHIRATLNNINISLYGSETLNVASEDVQDFGDIWKAAIIPSRAKLREFYSRWRNYIDYFDAMPFNDQLKKIGARDFADRLNRLFSGRSKLGYREKLNKEKEYSELNPFRRIGNLTSVLQNINKKYINPEPIAHILLIDDDKHFHQAMTNAFAGFDFYHVYSAEDAKNNLKTKNFDLILLDLQLSGADGNPLEGVDLIPILKELAPEIPLIIVSTHSRPSIIHRTLRSGADYYMSKSLLDVGKWINTFIKLMGKQGFAQDQILAFNMPDESLMNSTILIVDDEKEWFERLKNLSNDFNYKWAYTIQQAGDLLEAAYDKYDLLVLDLYYNENGVEKNYGIEFLVNTKSNFPDLPIIVMTRSPHDKDQLEALGQGADFYWIKHQFNGPIWLKSIKLLIETKKLKEQLNS